MLIFCCDFPIFKMAISTFLNLYCDVTNLREVDAQLAKLLPPCLFLCLFFNSTKAETIH